MTDEKDAKPDASTITLSTLISWVEDADNNTGDSRSLSEKCREYYDGRQWSGEEVRVLKKQKQAPIVVNRIKPKMDGLMGMERANKTTAKAFPRTPKHEKAATAATEAIRFCLQDNFYDQVRSTAWDNLCIEGTGGCEVIGKDLGDKVRITINPIMWDRIIYDPHSRRKDFGDARYLGQVVWMDYDLALDMYPDAEDVLQTMMQGSSTYADKPEWLDSKRRRVKIVELYYIEDGDVWYACFTYGGYCKDPQKSPYVNEEGDTEWPYEFASLHVGREGDRYGACKQYLDVQDEINKRRSKALHLMSVRQVMGERGAVEDVNKTRQELARPDGYVEVTPGMVFEVLKTGDMAAAQFNLLTEAKGEIDAVGFSAAASGKEERNMSGVALRNREAASQTELAPLFDVLKHLDVRVYRKVWNRIRQYWKDEMWIRVTDDPINLRWVGLNKPITRGQQMLEQAQQQGVPPEQLQALQQQLASRSDVAGSRLHRERHRAVGRGHRDRRRAGLGDDAAGGVPGAFRDGEVRLPDPADRHRGGVEPAAQGPDTQGDEGAGRRAAAGAGADEEAAGGVAGARAGESGAQGRPADRAAENRDESAGRPRKHVYQGGIAVARAAA
jgi:hypothetical protein